MTPIPPVREWRNVDLATFRNEIMPANQPALLKGLVSDWPAVQAGLNSDEELAGYIKRYDQGQTVNALVASPAVRGKLGYNETLTGLNFERVAVPVSAAVDKIMELRTDLEPMTVAVQSAAIPEHLPGFIGEDAMPLAPIGTAPRIWIGNRVTVSTHFDFSYNIACVVGGRRRFTLFPPEQMGNLYIGPLDFTPAGAPVSLVSLENPDLEKYPRFPEAMKHAQVAEMEPGDAIYIPFYWWHHVQSLSPFSVLVNYWWMESGGEPFEAMVHALTVMRKLTQSERDTWKAAFAHYVFQADGDPGAHIPQHVRGVLGGLEGEALSGFKAHLIAAIQRL